MAIRGHLYTLAVLTGAVLVTVALPALAESGDPPDLSGSWELNPRLSENPRDKMRESMQQRGGGAGGDKGGGMGGERGGGMDPEAMRRRGQELEQAAQSMTIVQAEPELTIRYADGRERRLFTDGREQRREDGIEDVETKAKWKKDGRLVVRATTERGQEIKEIFRYSPGESRIYVTVEIEGDGRMPTVSFERVYDRAAEPPGAG